MFDSGLGGSQTGDRHAVGGAGHVVQANLVAELHGGGVAAVLAADTQVDVGAGLRTGRKVPIRSWRLR